MKFHSDALEVGNPWNVAMYAEESGAWAVRADLTVTGSIRVNVWPRLHLGGGTYARVYCCGPQPLTARLVLGCVIQILEPLPPTVSVVDVERLLPEHTIESGRELRPIKTDPKLFETLMSLAGVAPDNSKHLFERVVCEEADAELPLPMSLFVP